jgi:hypothetical protein
MIVVETGSTVNKRKHKGGRVRDPRTKTGFAIE